MSNHTIHFFRLIDGKRVRYRVDLDADMTVVSETALHETPPVVPATGVGRSQTKDELNRRGIEYTETNGQLVITKIPESERKAIQAIVNPEYCWFPGCKEIMEKYAEEKENLPTDCPACQQGALIRKYRQLLIDAEQAIQAADTGSGKAA